MELNTPVTIALTRVSFGASERIVTIDSTNRVTIIGSQYSFSYRQFFDVNVILKQTKSDELDLEVLDNMIERVTKALESAESADPRTDFLYIANSQATDIKERKNELYFLKGLRPVVAPIENSED